MWIYRAIMKLLYNSFSFNVNCMWIYMNKSNINSAPISTVEHGFGMYTNLDCVSYLVAILYRIYALYNTHVLHLYSTIISSYGRIFALVLFIHWTTWVTVCWWSCIITLTTSFIPINMYYSCLYGYSSVLPVLK